MKEVPETDAPMAKVAMLAVKRTCREGKHIGGMLKKHSVHILFQTLFSLGFLFWGTGTARENTSVQKSKIQEKAQPHLPGLVPAWAKQGTAPARCDPT